MNIPLLVTLDKNYISQLKVLLTSVYINHPGRGFDVYLLHSNIPEVALSELADSIVRFNYGLVPIRADESVFASAKVTDRYPKEMYYRLLAAKWLPDTLDKILYLDPDILVINSLDELWNMDISDNLFAAAAHTGKTDVANGVNRIRLGTDTDYFNSGVLLMNLKRCREEIIPQEVFAYAENNSLELILPDQDILNALYGNRILEIDDARWNYDARNYSNYLLRSGGKDNMDWVIKNTSILHFCGRDKPWRPNYKRRFGALYRHYMNLTDRYM